MSINIYKDGQLKSVAGSGLMDAELSLTSTNGVQNKVVTAAINELNNDLTQYVEGTFQRSSGTITANSLKKYGNTVNCVFVMSGNSSPIRTSIAVIPEAFRPAHPKFGMCTISITGGFISTPIKIDTNGIVNCPFASAESAPDVIEFAFEYNLG